MVLEAHLVHRTIVWVSLAKDCEKFTHVVSFRPDLKLIGYFVKQTCVLVDHCYDVVEIVGQLSHIHSEFD